MVNMKVEIHALQASHIPFAMELKNVAGWNQTEEDWKSYLRIEQQGCFLAQVEASSDEKKAGTATVITYDGKVGWIGMVLVHPSKRRLGVGTALLENSIQYLKDNRIPCMKLDATPMGKKVYVPLGFKDEYEVRRYQTTNIAAGQGSQQKHIGLQSMRPEHLDQLAKWDADIFGVNRRKVLAGFLKRNPELCFCFIVENQITGYIMAHKGYEAYQIGPFLAEDSQTAEALLLKVTDQITGQKVFMDVPEPNQAALELVERHHFTIQRSFCRMYQGENLYPGQPDKVYGTSGAEKG
jgi:ribosomal protein S18 acetylase RimI-like enzyme